MEDNSFAQAFGNKSPFGQGMFINADEPMWEALIGKIIDGDVIPIIGPDVLTNDFNLHIQLIDFIAQGFKVKSQPKSFSELVYDSTYLGANRGNRDSIYTWLNEIFGPDAPKQKPSDLLVKLLGSKLFPFVITTTFTPIVEQVMRDVWGQDLRIMKFNNNPSENEDIGNELDFTRPTLYYMFGRVGDTRAHRYVVTDQDMLEFCSSWLDENLRPKKLVNVLKKKFLLMLGTDYSDWLFRFIWFSIRKEREAKGTKSDMIANSELEDSFIHFMERHETYMKQNPDDVVTEIVKRMDKQFLRDPKLKERLEKRIITKFSYPEEHADVFISYSRSDSAFVEALYEALTKKGLNVWYDKMNLTDGGKFMDEIKRAIQTAKFFFLILTTNVGKEKDEPHVYRNEWDIACGVGIGRTYIIPVSEKHFDFYHSHLPEKIQTHNAIVYENESDIPMIVDKVLNKIESKQ